MIGQFAAQNRTHVGLAPAGISAQHAAVRPITRPVIGSRLSPAPLMVQRAPAPTPEPIPGSLTPEPAPGSMVPQPASAHEAPAPGLIADDDAGALGPSQMRKGDFLDALQTTICALADAELAAVGRSTAGCPYLAGWMAYYRSRSSAHVERALRRYVPEAARATSARDYIPLVGDRVRRAVSVWATTGQVTGVPEGVGPTPPEAGGGEGGESPAAGAAATDRLQLMAAEGGASGAGNPAAVRQRLDAGRPLDGGVRSRMESAFGHDLAAVRIHTGPQAAALSSGLNARAFAVGADVAFASGHYQPGTLIGDALLAHELAHVVQQGGAVASPQASPAAYPANGGPESAALEDEADWSAVSAVGSLWGGAAGLFGRLGRRALPGLRSGLRLSRCGTCKKEPIITKTLDVFELAVRAQDPKTSVADAKQIWEDDAGISLSPTFYPPIGEKETRELIGTEEGEDKKPIDEVALDYPTDDDSPEINLLRGLRGKRGSGDMAAFFIPRLRYLAPSAVDPVRSNRIVYIGRQKCSPGFDLAHEIGHILLGFGHSTKWDSDLMHPEGCRPGLTKIECGFARGDPEAVRDYMRRHSR